MIPESILKKPELDTSFTSTGAKLFAHQEAMQALRDGKGRPISCWIAPTDVCNHKCAFCSVGERPGETLDYISIVAFLTKLRLLGLKSVTFSGGGNPLIYKCKKSGMGIEDCIRFANSLGLEVGLITNGLPLKDWGNNRMSWRTLSPEALDMLTWCRISMSGLDHNHSEQEVYVPDFNEEKTSLGFSWIMSDSYEEPTHKHGWVSTVEDTSPISEHDRKIVYAEDRLPFIESKIKEYVQRHHPVYVRLLANCLQPDRIEQRHRVLQGMAERIDPDVVFSQNKPPRQPKRCFKVLTRPCLNSDGWVYPCDSVVLNKTANHKFGSAWRICHNTEIEKLYEDPSQFQMPDNICPGCVFADQVDLINDVVNGMETPDPGIKFDHPNFV